MWNMAPQSWEPDDASPGRIQAECRRQERPACLACRVSSRVFLTELGSLEYHPFHLQLSLRC